MLTARLTTQKYVMSAATCHSKDKGPAMVVAKALAAGLGELGNGKLEQRRRG